MPEPFASIVTAIATSGRRRSTWLIAHVISALLLVLTVFGLPSAAFGGEAEAPPARVGVLAFIGGNARMATDPAAGWQGAELNTPVAAHMAFATDAESRLELRIGSSALWLAPWSGASLAELDDRHLAVEVARGRVVLRLRTLAAGEQASLGAGGLRLVLLQPGLYRVEYEPRRQRFVAHVIEGQGRLALAGPALLLGPGQWAVADLRNQASIEQGSGDNRAPIDELAERRARRLDRSPAIARVGAEVSGAEALDGAGAWRAEPGVGAVWYPDNLPLDWAPYRFGHWRWITPWGWNWIDDAPWGFAPSHYGRWIFLGGRWGWVPGSLASARPVYAPALVGFYGSAAGAGWTPPNAAAPVVGWYPLAPGEVYWPAYGAPLAYVRELNAPSVADAGRMQSLPDPNSAGPAPRYARTSFAATAVAESAFRALKAVAVNQVELAPAALAQAPLSARRAAPTGPP